MDFLLANWGAVVSVVSAIYVLASNSYKSKKSIEDTESNTADIKKLKEDIKDLVTMEKARETFVTKELYENQMGHIDQTLGEIKQQNQQILENVISK